MIELKYNINSKEMENTMTKKTSGRYDNEFKKMIVEKYDKGETVINLCKDFDLSEGTVYPWIKQYSKSGARGNAAKPVNDFSTNDYETLLKQNRDLMQENDVLKKCITIFSKK